MILGVRGGNTSFYHIESSHFMLVLFFCVCNLRLYIYYFLFLQLILFLILFYYGGKWIAQCDMYSMKCIKCK